MPHHANKFARRGHIGAVRIAGEIVEQADFGMEIVDEQEVVQAVAIEVRDVQPGDVLINGKNFRAAEAEKVRGRGRVQVGGGKKCERGGECRTEFGNKKHPRNLPATGKIGEKNRQARRNKPKKMNR